ncbi:MAG: ABC transporter permease [Saprospiraceae bacterium]
MKVFWAFVKKEVFHILRDRRTLFILFGMPIVQILIFGYAVTNEFKGANIAVYDQAKDESSMELIHQLQASGHFQLVKHISYPDELEAAFQSSAIKMAIVIPPDFGNNLYGPEKAQVQLLMDGTEPNTAITLTQYANQIIQQYQASLQGTPSSLPISVENRMVYNPLLKSVFLFVPGVMALILMLVSAMMTSLTIAKEKELGTMELLLVSPLPTALIIIGKVIPYVVLSLINAGLILGVGVYVFGVPIAGSFWLLMGVCMLFICVALTLGILISTRTDTQQAAMLTSLMGLMMPTIILSGFMFPIESMPWLLQKISSIIPAKYFIILLKDIMLKGSGWYYIWPEALVLLGMGLFLLVASIKNFKVRLT